MTTVLYNGFDDTIAETQISDVGGISGNTGRNGTGLAYRRTSATLFHLAKLPAALSTLYVGVGIRWSGIGASKAIVFVAPDGTTAHCAFGVDATGHAVIYGPAGTIVATGASATVVNNVWYFFEAKVIISDTVGVLEVKQDGVVVVSLSGDTRNGAATTVAFVDATSPVSNTDFDDLYVDDAGYLGDVTVLELAPNGDGDSSDWVGSDGNSVNNSLLVDDPTTSNMTDYVGASVSGKLDLYAMVDMAGHDVLAIQEKIYAQKSDAGTPPTLLPVAKGQSGTVRTDTALPALSTTALAYLGDIRTTDPDGNALTAARVNAMQVGLKIS